VVNTSSAAIGLRLHEPRHKKRSENVKRRIADTLETFPLLPDAALISIGSVSALLGRSKASIWRDVERGRLAAPLKVGHSTRWRAGDVRAALAGARHG
jgi:predicted DNA-binding transcriptional regulator AlpA